MDWLDNLNSKLSKGGAYISSSLFVALVCLIMTEILGRSLFDYSTMLADEYSGYFYLGAVFFGLAYTFNEGGHIRINLVTSRLSQNKQRFIDILAGVLATSILSYALYYSFLFTEDSKEMEMLSEAVSETPLWLTQIPMVLGMSLFVFAAFVYTLKRIFNDK